MNYTKISTEEITDWLKKNLTPKRYLHSLGTAECARELAHQFGQDEGKAYLTGLLHDCAKCLPEDELLKITKEHLHIDPLEMMSVKTLHAPAGAYLAQKEFGITDKEILSAIRWHTIGKLNMTTFEKIIYIADKIEPKTRDKNYLLKAREYLKGNNLDKAIFESYKETIKSLVDRELKICPVTIDIYNHLLNVN